MYVIKRNCVIASFKTFNKLSAFETYMCNIYNLQTKKKHRFPNLYRCLKMLISPLLIFITKLLIFRLKLNYHLWWMRRANYILTLLLLMVTVPNNYYYDYA